MEYATCLNNQCRVFIHGVKYFSKNINGKALTIDEIANACFLTKTTINDYMNGSRKANDYFYQRVSKLFDKSYDNSEDVFLYAQEKYIIFLNNYFSFDYDSANMIAYEFVKNNDLIFSVASTYYLFFSYYLTLIEGNYKKKKEFERLIEKYQLLDESMYIFYLIVKNEFMHFFDDFKFVLDTTVKISVIGVNNTIEEHLLINYYNLLYSWNIDNKDTHYIEYLINEFRYNGYYNFYFVLLCKNLIYNLARNEHYCKMNTSNLEHLYHSLNGKYNHYFYQVLLGYYSLLNGEIPTAYQYIEPLFNLKFFDISLMKGLLEYLIGNNVKAEKLKHLVRYYTDPTIACPYKINEYIQLIKKIK